MSNQILFFQKVFKMENSIPSMNQIWHWKELFTFISLVCSFFMIIPMTSLLLSTTYFQSIITQGIEIPVYINNKNQIMDGHHRVQAYHLLGREEIPYYRNKLWRNHGFCWKKGLEGKRRLRLKTW